MYPRSMVVDLGRLALPLLGTPTALELDSRGCFSREAVGSVEASVLTEATRRIDDWQPPEGLLSTAVYEDRWRFASAMQKAIRQNQPWYAMNAASGLFIADKAYLLRRLGTIAVEDVMGGAPFLVAATLAAMGQVQWRKMIGERRLMLWLANELADAPGDRSAVELLVRAEEDRSVDHREMLSRSGTAWLATAIDTSRPVSERALAAWLCGGSRYAAKWMPELPTPASDLFAVMAASGLSRWMLYVAAKTASRVQDAMFTQMILIDEWMRDETTRGFDVPTIARGPQYPHWITPDGLLGAGYDMYTRPGKVAIRQFFAESRDLRQFLNVVPIRRRPKWSGEGVFLAEGGVLDRRIVYSKAQDETHWWARGPELLHYWPRAMAEEYVPTIRRQLPALNRIRQQVLGVREEVR